METFNHISVNISDWLSQGPFSFRRFFFLFLGKEKNWGETDFSQLPSAMCFSDLYFGRRCVGNLTNQSMTIFVYFTQKGIVTSLTLRPSFNKVNSIFCKRNKSSSHRLSRLRISKRVCLSLGVFLHDLSKELAGCICMRGLGDVLDQARVFKPVRQVLGFLPE